MIFDAFFCELALVEDDGVVLEAEFWGRECDMGRVGVSDQGDVGLEWFGVGLDSLLGEFGFERVDVFAEGDWDF